MKKLFIYGTLSFIVIVIVIVIHYIHVKPPSMAEQFSLLDVVVATHTIYAPSPDEEAKKIKAFKNEPPLTQKDLDTAIKITPKLAKAVADNAKTAEIMHHNGFSAMRLQYVITKVDIIIVAIASSGQQAETMLAQAQMPDYLRPTAAEVTLVRKNEDAIQDSFFGRMRSQAQPLSASEATQIAANLKKEPPLTQKDIESFIKIAPELDKMGNDKAKLLETLKQNGLSPMRLLYVSTKVGTIFEAFNHGGKEQVYAMQSKIPEHLRATPSEVDLIIKNQDALNNLFLEAAATLPDK